MQSQKSSTWVYRDQTKMQNSALAFCLSSTEKLSIMEALDHIHVTRQYQEMGSCSVCKKISIKKCSACGTFYCSSECQTYDWPKHKVVCSRQRDGTSDRNSLNSSKQIRVGSLKNLNDDNFVLTERGSPFTTLANQLNKKSGNEFGINKSLANFKIGNKQYQNREQISKGSEAGNLLKVGTKDYKKNNTFDRKKGFTQKKSLVEEKRGGNGNNKNIKNNQSSEKTLKSGRENIPISDRESQSNLTKIRRMEVIGTYRHSAERYWVMDVNNFEKYEEIQNHLNRNCEKYGTVIPKVGLVCSCIFADEWFRGKIISLTPEISVHFIDFGNTSRYDQEVFRKLPDNLQSLPGLAFLIEFDESTSSHYRTSDLDSARFFIEETAVAADGVPRVRVIEKASEATDQAKLVRSSTEENEVERMAPPTKRSVMDTIKSTSTGMIILMPGEGAIRYGSLVPDDNKDANGCVESVLSIDNSNATPVEARNGDYVLVIDKEGNDQRGKVLSYVGTTYYVQLVDCGNVISTDSVYPLPENLRGLIELGVKITVGSLMSERQMEKLETCFFSVTGEENAGKWPCILKDTEYEIIAKVSLEKPLENLVWQPKYIHLKSGSTVEICSSSPPDSLYVRTVDGEAEQQFFNLNMELMDYSKRAAKSFATPPSPGELCCARFQEDNCFYRAIVNSLEKDKANVLFVDFGNEQETDLNDVKILPNWMKSFPFFAVKVCLSNVSRRPWNNMIKEYIGKLISDNVELTLSYEGAISNGVTLREKVSGVVVNEFVEKSRDRNRISNSMKSGSDLSTKTEIFLDDDMQYTMVTSGTKCDLAILYVSEYEFETHHTFWATIAGVANFDYVNLELNSLITEHCSNISAPYEPSYRELCLAEYEGSWYRAICAGKDEGNFKVFFVDFGNVCTVKAESIRKMVQKFMKAPALAMNCTVSGYEQLKKNPDLTEKVCGILLERVNTCIKGVEVSKFKEDTYLLKIPEIEAVLSG